ERSWNRVFVNFNYSKGNWYASFKPWALIFNHESSNLHNPRIAHYLGYERLLLSYKLYSTVTTLKLRNTVESGFKRSSQTVSFSFPLNGRIRGYAQFFNGYGQSLIEYDHETTSFGIGIAL